MAKVFLSSIYSRIARITAPSIRLLALLGLCAAYLQGGLSKLIDFNGALGEMHHFALEPATPIAAAVIALELGASAMIITGYGRWVAALALSGFTIMASVVANHYWNMSMPERFGAENAFFEHMGLAGGFLFVALSDLQERVS